jgi:hypothetical protein
MTKIPVPGDDRRQASRDWLTLLGPGVGLLALGILALADAIALIVHVGVRGKQVDLTVFIVSALLLPPICAAIQVYLVRPDSSSSTSSGVEAVNIWTAVGLLITLAIIPLLIWAGVGTGDVWLRGADRTIIAFAALQGVALAVTSKASAKRGKVARILTSRTVQVTTFLPALFLCSGILFSINPANRHLNLFVSLFLDPRFADEAGQFPSSSALILAALMVTTVFVLGHFDALSLRRKAARRWYSTIAACLAFFTAAILLFDFSLAHDVFHYLTNVGPALHILHGGRLMVDTFSQYGPGPVLLTLLAFKIGPTSFGMAQLTTQLCNFVYFGVWLICLSRMSQWKLAASFSGLLAFALFLASWGRGYGNVNEAPSILALRYLPTLLMVLAISNLAPPRRFSFFTVLATFISSQWSFESLVGTLGVHLAFVGMLALRDRAFVRLVVDGVVAVVPAIAGIATTTAVTMLVTGSAPDFATYLAFLTSYNPMAPYWAIVASPMFFGWLPMFFAVLLTFGDAWTRIFRRHLRVTDADDETLFYRFVPMAVLLMFQITYFVGRSVDFTLGMSLLSFAAIAIPPTLAGTAAVLKGRWPVSTLGLLPAATAILAMTFTSVLLFRRDASYSLLLHECRDVHRCSPTSLAQGLDETIHIRPLLEHVPRPVHDGTFDNKGVVRDALDLISRWAPDQPLVTTLLGTLVADLQASEVTLMYSGKWDRWPRSFTLSDELVRPLAQRIIAAPVRLHDGEVIIVRRDEKALGYLETGILTRIRSETNLCQLPGSSSEVVAYRVAGKSGCPAD